MTRVCGQRRRKVTAKRSAETLRDVVDAFISNHRIESRQELRFFELQRSLAKAVRPAAMCELPGGKRHPHQRRIPKASLVEATERLLAADLAPAQDFDELHDAIADLISDIWMISELTIYDIAQRIGAHLGLQPKRVYLHRGTRTGARELGLGRGRKTLEMHELPQELRRLTAAEAEDCLCIYKDRLRAAAKRSSRNGPASAD